MRKGPESVYDKCNIIVGVIEVLKVVNLNPIHGEVQLIQHYVIKFISDLQQVVVFSGYSGWCNCHLYCKSKFYTEGRFIFFILT